MDFEADIEKLSSEEISLIRWEYASCASLLASLVYQQLRALVPTTAYSMGSKNSLSRYDVTQIQTAYP
jgi:hypothetical protein